MTSIMKTFCSLLYIVWMLFICLTTSQAMNFITGSTTWGTMLEEADPQEFKIENIIGSRIWHLGVVKLDGKQNRMTLNLGPLTQELDFDDFSGGVEADMQIAKVGIMGDPDGGGRNYVYIKGECGLADVELQLEYEPGMGAITTSAALAEVPPTPYRFVLTNALTGDTWTHSGVAGKDQNPREQQLSLSQLKNNLRAYLGQSVRIEGVFDYIYPCQECEQPVLKNNGVVLKVYYPCYLEPGSEPYDQTRVRARAEVIQDNVRGICVELTHVNGIDLKRTSCSRLYGANSSELRLEHKNWNQTCISNDSRYGHLFIDYPQIRGMENTQRQQVLNRLIRGTFLRDCDPVVNILIQYQIGCFNRRLVSLVKNESFDGGGAHPLTSQEGLTFNMINGRVYGFSDLFQGEYGRRIRELVAKDLYR